MHSLKRIPIIASTMLAAMSANLTAQSPDPSGAWKLSSFDLGFTTHDGTVWGSSALETIDLTINPNGTFTVPEGAGDWFFSDDFLSLDFEGTVSAAITRDLDTIVFADADNEGGGSNVGINAGVRLPDADFIRADVAGTWQLLRQTSISFSDSFFDATGYNGVFHAHETLVLSPNGNFTLTVVSNTDPGDDDEGSISGRWSIVGRGIRLSAGGETYEIPNLSAGLDTFIDFRTELSSQGSNTNSNRNVEYGIKQPATLSASDLVGRWGFTGMTIDVEDDLTPTYSQEFRGAFFESGDVSLFPDGTGLFRRTRTNDPGLPDTENFTWRTDASRLIVTDSDGEAISFHVSAGKDFAVSLNIEDGPGGDTDAYDVFTVSRLPNAPGIPTGKPVITLIGANPINLVVGDAFTDPGADVTDDVDNPRVILGSGSVNTAVPGTYTLIYTASDEDGNAATPISRTIIVSNPVITLPSPLTFTTSVGGRVDLSNVFNEGLFEGSSVAVVGKLPPGLRYDARTGQLTGYPTRPPAQAEFLVTLPDQEPQTVVMEFEFVPFAPSLIGSHVIQTAQGDNLTIQVSNSAAATVRILSPGTKREVAVRATVNFNPNASDPSETWTISAPAQNLEIAFPVMRTLNGEQGAYLGNYGQLDGKPLWGYRATDSIGQITLSRGETQITLTAVTGAKGSVSWTITPISDARPRAIRARGLASADGILSLAADLPGFGPITGMLRVDEQLDDQGVPTGELVVLILQGFTGWTPVAYVAP